MMLSKITVYDKSVAKVNNIDSTGFVLKTKCDTDKSDLKKRISDAEIKNLDTSDLAKKTDLKAEITEIEGKIPTITGLATNLALAAVRNEITDVSNLVKKREG